ncbi:hypothetical protein AQI88_35320 [Streptomyces cellostaticus]|uniref:Uncharacterized protein n=1 Tax=Streptomyces cellostaticus TaxID=67285 RepID=A0A101NEU8_9ACTN|nr:hypothetical protein [Streptomyces cellostaticus]KUM91697.1 hypothetical protein AQI88_35320 [Streptomyces cellostaticus]GHI04163.1 hypothetical protein Scel_24840 [Streptomyces cellostaticus]
MNPTTAARTFRKNAAIAAGLAGAAVLGLFATAQAADAGEASHAAKAAHSATAPYVINHYGEKYADTGHAERRSKVLVLSEFTSIHQVSWKQWGAKKAVGTGKVTGNWCLDTCLDKPLKATISLSDPKTVGGKKVYSAFTLKLSGHPGTYDAEDLQGKRPLATS